MPQLRRTLNGPFLVDESKLSRLIQVSTEALDSPTVSTSYAVGVGTANMWNLQTLSEVLTIDNTKTRPIRSLEVKLVDGKKQKVGVEVDGGAFPVVTLTVVSDDHKSAINAFSKIEEQAERLMLTGFDRFATTVLPVMSLAIGAVLFLSIGFMIPGKSVPADILTKSDIAELTKRFNAPTAGVADLIEFNRRELRNLASHPMRAPYGAGTWATVAVVTFVFGAFFFAVRSHRRATFLWGDEIARHAIRVRRREWLWRTVFFGTLVGIGTKIALSYAGH